MSWENEMVSLVKKLSKDVKNSPNYKERKNQMLEERREYIKQEKMKRRKSSTANSGSILTSSEALKSRPKTATNRVSFASDSSEKPTQFVDKESIGVMCDQQNELDQFTLPTTKCMGTNTSDLNEFCTNTTIKPLSKDSYGKTVETTTTSFGTSTDDLNSYILGGINNISTGLYYWLNIKRSYYGVITFVSSNCFVCCVQ